jgi:hypothetical protein
MDLKGIMCGLGSHGFSEHGNRPSGFINDGEFYVGLLGFELCPTSGVVNSSVAAGERSARLTNSSVLHTPPSRSSGMGNLLSS